MKHVIDDRLVIVGTAHVSRKSAEEVELAIEEHRPEVVAVELDRRRYEALADKTKWEGTPVTQMIRGGNAFLFLAQVFASSMQRRLGREYGAEPGVEMLAAIRSAEARGLKVEMVDRDITRAPAAGGSRKPMG